MPLVPCPSCHRHLRPTERACPFCASRLEPDALRTAAAAIALAVAASALTGCPRTATKYGAPPPEPPAPTAEPSAEPSH